jgi:hypothetical protein
MDKMVDMKRTDAEIKAKNSPMKVTSGSRESYPYGLSLTLDADSLKKLGIKDLPTVGDEFEITAMARVTSVSKNASETNDSTRVELQITQMCVESEADEAADEDEKTETYASSTKMRFK